MDRKRVGHTIRHHRRVLGLTQKQLAALADVTEVTVQRWEASGRIKDSAIPRLALSLRISPDELWGETAKRDPEVRSILSLLLQQMKELGETADRLMRDLEKPGAGADSRRPDYARPR